MSAPAGPTITDAYWFEWSKKHLDSALERRTAAFETLQKLVLWLWGIYTTYAATGFALSTKEIEPVMTLVIIAASVLLIAVYWACVWGQMPIPVEFDPRSPTEIREAYDGIIEKRDARLKFTMGLSLVAAASVSFALYAASASGGPGGSGLSAVASPAGGGRVSLAVTAHLAPETAATVEVDANPGSQEERRDLQRDFLSLKDGTIQTGFEVPAAEEHRIRVSWVEAGTERSMSKTISLK